MDTILSGYKSVGCVKRAIRSVLRKMDGELLGVVENKVIEKE